MATVEHLITADELFRTPNLGRCELILGELFKMAPAGSEHGGIIGNLTSPLHYFVRKHRLGKVFGAETGFFIHRDPGACQHLREFFSLQNVNRRNCLTSVKMGGMQASREAFAWII
jgi:Uma2 family endonuclease